MRRKPGMLLPLELSILEVALVLREGGEDEFHGFALARELKAHDGSRTLTAHGTLYKALGRMERTGLLESRWEDPDAGVREGRPRRRLYRVTGAGERALRAEEASTPRPELGLGGAG